MLELTITHYNRKLTDREMFDLLSCLEELIYVDQRLFGQILTSFLLASSILCRKAIRIERDIEGFLISYILDVLIENKFFSKISTKIVCGDEVLVSLDPYTCKKVSFRQETQVWRDFADFPPVKISIESYLELPSGGQVLVGPIEMELGSTKIQNPIYETINIIVRATEGEISYLVISNTRIRHQLFHGFFIKEMNPRDAEDLEAIVSRVYGQITDANSRLVSLDKKSFSRATINLTKLILPEQLRTYLSDVTKSNPHGGIIFTYEPESIIPHTELTLNLIPWEVIHVGGTPGNLGLLAQVSRQFLVRELEYIAERYSIVLPDKALLIGNLLGDLEGARREIGTIGLFLEEQLGIDVINIDHGDVDKVEEPRIYVRELMVDLKPRLIHVASHIGVIEDAPYILLPKNKNMPLKSFIEGLEEPCLLYLNTCSSKMMVLDTISRILGRSLGAKYANLLGIICLLYTSPSPRDRG